MVTLIQNIRILTMDAVGTIFENGYVLIKNDRIDMLGAGDAGINADVIIDGSGKVLMPGLINGHHHLAMSLLRGVGSDLPLMRWLTEAIFPREDRLTGDAIYWGSMLGIAEMLSMGVTTFNDMYFFMADTARACLETGIRAHLTRGLSDIAGGGDERLADNIAFYKDWNDAGDGLIKVGLGPHAEYTCSVPFLHKCRDASAQLDCALHLHLSETKREVDECLGRHGVSPVRLMANIGIFERPTVAAHCVWVDEDDMDILLKHKVAVAHNPTSNLKLGSGIAPIARMREKGILVCLGTDGAASNNNMDVWEEMTLAAMLQKGINQDPSLMPIEDVLRMATIEGAKALNWQDDIGSIEIGKKADLILIDVKTPTMTPLAHWKDNLVYAADSRNVCLTMIGGKILYQDGKWLTLDVEQAMTRATEAARVLEG